MIMAFHNMNIQRTHHQKCLTRFVESHGLNRLGIKILSFLGITTSNSTNDRHSKKSLMQYDEDIKTIITSDCCVLGFDNYNHAYGSSVYNPERKSQLVLANFTVFGVSCCQRDVERSFVFNEHEEPFPSVPKDRGTLSKYVPLVMKKIRHELCSMNETAEKDYCYWNIAQVVEEDLRTVPVTSYDPKNRKPIHDRGRAYDKPWFVTGRNSASNIGIAHIFSHIYNATQHVHTKGEYSFVKMDVNLYNKFLQVLFFFKYLL